MLSGLMVARVYLAYVHRSYCDRLFVRIVPIGGILIAQSECAAVGTVDGTGE